MDPTPFERKLAAAFQHAAGAPVTLRIRGQERQFETPDAVRDVAISRGTLEHALDTFNARFRVDTSEKLHGAQWA